MIYFDLSQYIDIEGRRKQKPLNKRELVQNPSWLICLMKIQQEFYIQPYQNKC